MGRLDDIIARNRKPPRGRERLEFGLRSIFLLVILALLIFTDWALSPEDTSRKPPPPPETPRPAAPGHVPGVFMK